MLTEWKANFSRFSPLPQTPLLSEESQENVACGEASQSESASYSPPLLGNEKTGLLGQQSGALAPEPLKQRACRLFR